MMIYVIENAHWEGLYYGVQPYDNEPFWASHVKDAVHFATYQEARVAAFRVLKTFAMRDFIIRELHINEYGQYRTPSGDFIASGIKYDIGY